MSKSATPRFLLEGAVYALEQSGFLLRDAALLYRKASYASAVALSAFAREELGRWRILLELHKEAIGGTAITLNEIETRCGDHVRKQTAGMLSTTMRADRNSGLGQLLSSRSNALPGSDEWNALDEQIEKLDRQLGRSIPDDRHKQRMSALYAEGGPRSGVAPRASGRIQPYHPRLHHVDPRQRMSCARNADSGGLLYDAFYRLNFMYAHRNCVVQYDCNVNPRVLSTNSGITAATFVTCIV